MNFLKRLILILNIVAVFCLILSYLSSYISPVTNSWLPFFGLAYPFILLGNFIFILIWIPINWKMCLISIGTILIGTNHLTNTYAISLPGKPNHTENSINVMSYNVRLFDLYNWSKNKDTRNRIFDYLKNKNPDIICFQEFFHADNPKYFITKDTLTTFLKAKHVHDEYTLSTKKGHRFGSAIFSSYPIINTGKIVFSNDTNNICIYADLAIHNDTVRVYNAHIASIRFQPEDYEALAWKDQSQNIKRSNNSRIIERMSKAYVKRYEQIMTLKRHLEKSPHPIILCGDFNDSSVSYFYRQINSLLSDAFVESGSGLGNTYIAGFPSFRIDYIFKSDNIKSFNFNIQQKTLSDHQAISAQLILPGN